MLWVPIEVPRRVPQHMFLWRNKKYINNFWLKNKAPYLELCIQVSLYRLLLYPNSETDQY